MTKLIDVDKIPSMTQPISDIRFSLAMERGEVREAMGWSFVSRLERLVDELLSKPDCPEHFWIIYSAKWDEVERKIKELWQVDDKAPKGVMLGQIIYHVHKSGKADFIAAPLDIPVPDSEYSDEIVSENMNLIQNLGVPLSDDTFEKVS